MIIHRPSLYLIGDQTERPFKQLPKMNQLPDNYLVKKDPSNPLWGTYIKSLESKPNFHKYHGVHNYYGIVDGNYRYTDNPSLAPIITLDQWNRLTNRPKYYAILSSKENKRNPLWSKYIAHLNEVSGGHYSGSDDNAYYGIDGGIIIIRVTSVLEHFANKPEVLTLERWNYFFGDEQPNYMVVYDPVDGNEPSSAGRTILSTCVSDKTTNKMQTLTKTQLREIKSKVSCSEIKNRIDVYLKANWERSDTEPLVVSEDHIKEVNSKASQGDRNVIGKYLNLSIRAEFESVVMNPDGATDALKHIQEGFRVWGVSNSNYIDFVKAARKAHLPEDNSISHKALYFPRGIKPVVSESTTGVYILEFTKG